MACQSALDQNLEKLAASVADLRNLLDRAVATRALVGELGQKLDVALALTQVVTRELVLRRRASLRPGSTLSPNLFGPCSSASEKPHAPSTD